MKKTVLILSKRYSSDSQELYRAALQKGWLVWRFVDNNIPAWVRESEAVIYCETAFADYLAQELNLSLFTPEDSLLAYLPIEYVRREIIYTTYKEYRPFNENKFIKPADYKYFPAGIYGPEDKIPGFEHCHQDDPLLISSIVAFVNEYRFFVLEGEILAGSPYVINKEFVGDKSEEFNLAPELMEFAYSVVSYIKNNMSKPYVLDVGQLDNGEFAVIEFNPAWGSGIYACEPMKVLDCLKATVTKRQV